MAAPYIRYELNDIIEKPPLYFLLSNQDVKVFMNTYGGGYLKLSRKQISRTRLGNEGHFFYIKDCHSDQKWSSTLWPTNIVPDSYSVELFSNLLKFSRSDGDIDTTTEITVSLNDALEIRKITIKNNSNIDRDFEVTSYMEVILLADIIRDIDHPQFSNLFVQTHYDKDLNGIFFTRRNFEEGSSVPVMFSRVVSDHIQNFTFETNRQNFLGRLHSIKSPKGLDEKLKDYVGDVLDPIAAQRVRVHIKSGEEKAVFFCVMLGRKYEDVFHLARKYMSFSRLAAEFEEASKRLNSIEEEQVLGKDDILYFSQILSRMHTGDVITDNYKKIIPLQNQEVNVLWRHSISGDFPMLYHEVVDQEDQLTAFQILKCFKFLRKNRFKYDQVFVINDPEFIDTLRSKAIEMELTDKINARGGVFFLNRSEIDESTLLFMKRFARLILTKECNQNLNYVRNV